MKNKKTILTLAALMAILLTVMLTLLAGCGKEPEPAEEAGEGYLSIGSVLPTENGTYLADETGGLILHLDAAGGEIARYEAGEPVHKILADGETIYALTGGRDGKLLALDKELHKTGDLTVGHTPTDMVISDGKGYICCRFDGTLRTVELSSMTLTATEEAGREPMTLALAGDRLYVGNFLPEGTAADKDNAATVTVFHKNGGKAEKKISLSDGSHSIHGMAVSPDGKAVYLTHILARYGLPTTQLDRGWVNTNAFTVLDTATDESITYLLDSPENGAANPWDAELSSDGGKLYISISGRSELAILDLGKLTEATEQVKSGKDKECETVDAIGNLLSFLQSRGVITRVKLDAKGLRDISVYDGKVYAASYFDGKLFTLSENGETISAYTLPDQKEPTGARLGEMLWYDGNSCYQGWESCSSCHPEGRCDGLGWDESGDGYGTPKNTKSMIFSTRTPPAMATGCVDSAEENAYESIRFVYCNNALTDEEISCVTDYLRSLVPVESPFLTADGGYSEAALRGKALFESAGCAACHPAPLYTDLKSHTSPFAGSDGTGENREMATPTLVELWRSAPYAHTGYFNDPADVIKAFAPSLQDSEVSDLREFLLSIGTVEEQYGVAGVTSGESGLGCLTSFGADSTALTVLLQKLQTGAPDATVTVKLCASDGSEKASESTELKGMKKGDLQSYPLTISVAEAKSGDYLEISFRNGETLLATPTRLYAE